LALCWLVLIRINTVSPALTFDASTSATRARMTPASSSSLILRQQALRERFSSAARSSMLRV
jgi:hypothetical protein